MELHVGPQESHAQAGRPVTQPPAETADTQAGKQGRVTGAGHECAKLRALAGGPQRGPFTGLGRPGAGLRLLPPTRHVDQDGGMPAREDLCFPNID